MCDLSPHSHYEQDYEVHYKYGPEHRDIKLTEKRAENGQCSSNGAMFPQ